MNSTTDNIIYVDDSPSFFTFFCPLAGITTGASDYHNEFSPARSYVFSYVTSGSGYLDYGGTTNRIVPGDMYIISKGETVTCRSDNESPLEQLWFHADGRLFRKAVSMLIPSSVYIVNGEYEGMFREIHEMLSKSNTFDPSLISCELLSKIFSLMSAATRDIHFPGGSSSTSLEEKIKKYIDNNIYKDIDVGSISGQFGISDVHVIRTFKKRYRTTPGQYIIEKKMEIAKSLLVNTVMPLRDIASLLHYSNTQHFSTTFKNIVGTTPASYRKRIRES